MPDGYGTENFRTDGAAGGLSGAVTDVARLLAMMLSYTDTPALARATVESIMNAGIAVEAARPGRPGYGWDYIRVDSSDPHRFYAQKGGAQDTNHSVMQIDGDFGFVMVWAGSSSAAPTSYPDWPEVMNVARAVLWNQDDLFPLFGMPSF